MFVFLCTNIRCEMNKYKIHVVEGNSYGDVIRCPECGQVLYVMNDLEGQMKITVQCRRCHSYVEVGTTSDDIAEQEKPSLC